MDKHLYSPFENMKFSYDNCFLCGKKLDTSNRSEEHVIPKWIQNKYNLWDKTIVLLNGTEIQYRQLKIPCCNTCNNQSLSILEDEIKNAVELGIEGIKNLEEIRLYQWLLKIFYGLLFKELSLSIDRKNPEAGTITTPYMLKRFETLHFFLQSVRMPFKFQSPTWSIFILETYINDDIDEHFNYIDDLLTLTFSIKLGSIYIISCLEDLGAQKETMSEYFKKLEGIRLHEIQIHELIAKVHYKSRLFNRIPKYANVLSNSEEDYTYVIPLPLQSYSNIPMFNDWSQREYAKFLAHYLKPFGLTFEDIFREPSYVMSFIEDEENKFKLLDEKGKLIKFI